MNGYPQEQVSAQSRVALEQLLATQAVLLDGLQKLVELNMGAIRSSLDDNVRRTREAAQCQDAQEFVEIASALGRPDAAVDYGKRLFELLHHIHGDLLQLAARQVSDGQRQMMDAADQFVRRSTEAWPAAQSAARAAAAQAGNVAMAGREAMEEATRRLSEAAAQGPLARQPDEDADLTGSQPADTGTEASEPPRSGSRVRRARSDGEA